MEWPSGLEIPWAMSHDVFPKYQCYLLPFPSSTYRRLADFSVQNGFSATVLLKQRLTFDRLAVAKSYQSTGGSYDANNMKRVWQWLSHLFVTCSFMPHFWQKQFHMISYWSPSCEMTTDDKKILKHSETWTVPVHCPVCVDCDVCRPLRSERSSWPTDPVHSKNMVQVEMTFDVNRNTAQPHIQCKLCNWIGCKTSQKNAQIVPCLFFVFMSDEEIARWQSLYLSTLTFTTAWQRQKSAEFNDVAVPLDSLGTWDVVPDHLFVRFFQTKIVHTGICFLYMSM